MIKLSCNYYSIENVKATLSFVNGALEYCACIYTLNGSAFWDTSIHDGFIIPPHIEYL